MVDGDGEVRTRLRRVAELVQEMSRVSDELDLAVCVARDAGASWRGIAEALGCSPQAAHKRYRWARHSLEGLVWHEPPLAVWSLRELSTED